MNRLTVHAKGRASREAGAVRQLAGMLKRDRGLEAKGLAQRTKGAVQEAAGKAARKVTE